MITLIQLVSVIFVTFAASRALLRAKDKKISIGELFFWLFVWGGLIFVVFFPELTSYAARFLGIGRGIDVIVYVSIALLFYMVFRIYVKIDEVEKEITKVVREIALKRRK